MIDSLNSNTVGLVKLALEVAQENQKITANNIANINANNLTGMQLNFSDIFSEQLKSDVMNKDLAAIEELKADVTAGNYIGVKEGGVSLEDEMIAMTDNVIRYRTLLNALGSRGEIMKMAIQTRST